jgi:hypothetical protein
MQYSNNAQAHKVQLEKYLVREGTDIDGTRAKLFGTDIEEYRQNMAAKNFRIFLSPQDSKTDLKRLAENFVKKLELQTGYKILWQGACHYNTAHPHAHLLINGVDKNGKEITFPKDVVKTFMRETARDLCTSQLGSRTREDLKLDKQKELSAPRFTRLDNRIKELCNGTFCPKITDSEKERSRIYARLANLKDLKLAAYIDGGYKLNPRWEDTLKANGRYNVFLQAQNALPFGKHLEVYKGDMGMIAGKVSKLFRTDGDASDNHAAVVTTAAGKTYFVPFFKKPETAGPGGIKKPLKEGDAITLKTYRSQTGRLTPVIYSANEKHEMERGQRRSVNG